VGLQKLLTVQSFFVPGKGTATFPTAENILVANLLPLGCVPAMLTQFQSPNATYDTFGCLSELNEITAAHNQYLSETVSALRAKHPTVNIYYGDMNAVYIDILNDPLKYSAFREPEADNYSQLIFGCFN